MFLVLLAYFGGVLTILSPCILPVLPFVFARSDQPFRKSGLPLLAGMCDHVRCGCQPGHRGRRLGSTSQPVRPYRRPGSVCAVRAHPALLVACRPALAAAGTARESAVSKFRCRRQCPQLFPAWHWYRTALGAVRRAYSRPHSYRSRPARGERAYRPTPAQLRCGSSHLAGGRFARRGPYFRRHEARPGR